MIAGAILHKNGRAASEYERASRAVVLLARLRPVPRPICGFHHAISLGADRLLGVNRVPKDNLATHDPAIRRSSSIWEQGTGMRLYTDSHCWLVSIAQSIAGGKRTASRN